jgi:hypothetical protein
MALANPLGVPDKTLGPFTFTEAPVAGTNEVQTITIGGTPTAGSFQLTFKGQTTAAITWSATNNTLRDRVDAALEALTTIGADNVTTAVGTMTSGVGTLTVTFVSALGKKDMPLMTVRSALTGTSPTIAVTTTTPGVNATLRGAAPGALAIRTDTPLVYVNTGTAIAPTWTLVSSNS